MRTEVYHSWPNLPLSGSPTLQYKKGQESLGRNLDIVLAKTRNAKREREPEEVPDSTNLAIAEKINTALRFLKLIGASMILTVRYE